MTLEQKPAKGTSLTEALTVDRHASSAKFLRSYNQKSEDCPDGSIENQRPTAQSGWPRNECSALGQISSVRLKSRPKSKTVGRTQSRPGKHCPRSATPRHDRARPNARAGKRLAAAQLSAYHGRCAVRAGKLRPASGRDFIGQIHRPTTAADHASVRPRPFRLGHIPDCPADRPDDRPNAAVDPKPFLKPKLMFSSPA
ncbi:unnamed protein product [Microthlaspi erraticum]|uniref:Uncharacterized protein n=1 Tax=Microthlaspi erraticum TaxID=1685480 RepID=A0A6D2HXT3_9BRAS|nr:unnamed protein product [Microthlaspi erraticum]